VVKHHVAGAEDRVEADIFGVSQGDPKVFSGDDVLTGCDDSRGCGGR